MMASTALQPPAQERSGFGALVFGSILLHAIVLVGIPLAARLAVRPHKNMARPQTFQMVSLPKAPPPSHRAKAPSVKPVSELPSVKPGVKPKPVEEEPKPVEEEAVDDELADLLNEIPSPTQVSSLSGNFQYPWYLTNVQQKIERSWNPPMKKEGIEVEVSFTIRSDGTINEPRITASSGISTLDNLALRAVTVAAPFGKLPPGFSGDELAVSCKLKPIAQ